MFTHNALLAEAEKLQKFALRLTKNKSDADDLVQSTCLRALEKENSFEDGTNLFGWTSKIMFNLFVSDYRRKVKYGTRGDPEIYIGNQTVPAMQEIGAEVGNIKRAMLKLRPAHQEIVVLICVKGMHYEEVSNLLNIPVGTVRSRLSRARKELQEIMAISTEREVGKVKVKKSSENLNTPVIPAYIAAQVLQAGVHR